MRAGPSTKYLGTGYGLLFSNGNFGAYSVIDPTHWVFEGTGVQAGTFFGTTSLNGNAILGHEIDVVDELFSPSNIQVLARGKNLRPSYQLNIRNCNMRQFPSATEGGDMVYFDHPGGGAVFGAPTVAFGGSAMVDPVVSRILENVLERFLQPAARCVLRNGSGVNPLGFDCVTAPALGSTWSSTIATTPQTISTLVALAATPAQTPFFGGEILIGLVPTPLLQTGNGAHATPIPNVSSLMGVTLHAQGIRFEQTPGGPTAELLNAQDLTLGR